MLYFTDKKGNCTGCSACFAACPVGCISLEKDEEGFLYPVATDKCINCGMCQKVCPIENGIPKAEYIKKPKAYCAVTKDKKVWQRSASGGAFSEICYAYGDDDTIICGAAWDGFEVHHICVEGVNGVAPLCKSKYVASALDNVFKEIKNYLDAGRKVIFCGTPCQVAGLRGFLKKDYERLLLIDLICHGVGSPDVFKASMDVIGKQLDLKVEKYEFRAKKRTHIQDYLNKICFGENKEMYITDDPYIQLFLSQKCLRPACGENCRFRDEKRQGDITIADFKGLQKVFPDLMGSKKNYSSVIVNTKKGEKIIPILMKNMIIRECDIRAIKEYNPLFYRQTWYCEERDEFFGNFIKDDKKAIADNTKPVKIYRESLKRKVWNLAPLLLRKIVARKSRLGGK